MLKSILFRRENWLLVIPVFLLLSSNVFIGNSAIDIHLHDTYYVIRTSHVVAWLLLLVVLPYLCHVFLRLNNSGRKNIINAHIYLTQSSYIAALLILVLMPLSLKRNDSYSFENWNEISTVQYLFAMVFVIYLLTQVLFFLYFLIMIFWRREFDNAK